PLRIARRCSARQTTWRACATATWLPAGVTTWCAAGKNSRPQPRTHRLCLGPGNMMIMQIFIYRFTDASRGKIDGSDVTAEEAAELRTLIDAFDELHPETLRIADECHRKVAETLARPSTRDPTARRRKETAAA